MINEIKEWSPFLIGDLFDIRPTKTYSKLLKEEIDDGGRTPLVVNSAVNNGVGGFSSLDPTEEGGVITFSDTTEGNTFFYQPKPFIGFPHVQGMYPRNREWTENECLFLITMLTFINNGRYNYGRKMTRKNISETIVQLPSKKLESGCVLDFETMEEFMENIKHRERSGLGSLENALITKKQKSIATDMDIRSWNTYKISDLFKVRYGINIDLNKCEITTLDDKQSVNYVSRTSGNNGITARVKIIEGKEPQPAGVLTCAGGGSVLSTFLQNEPFYSGRDLYLLIPKYEMSTEIKMFLITVIESNKYRYNYGRQANITLPFLELKLPSINDEPDWQYMENYIKKLPYGDKIY